MGLTRGVGDFTPVCKSTDPETTFISYYTFEDKVSAMFSYLGSTLTTNVNITNVYAQQSIFLTREEY